MNCKYSEMLSSIALNNYETFLTNGTFNKVKMRYRTLSQSGEYEALIYFSVPFVLCGKLKDPIDFVRALGYKGRQWEIFDSSDLIAKFIERRFRFYGANVNNPELPLIVFYWMFTNPLSLEPPKDKNEFEFVPMESLEKLPPLTVLMNKVNRLEKI